MLTLRERTIIQYLIEGKTQKEVSQRVFIPHETLKVILRRLRAKYDCKTTIQLCIKINTQMGKAVPEELL